MCTDSVVGTSTAKDYNYDDDDVELNVPDVAGVSWTHSVGTINCDCQCLLVQCCFTSTETVGLLGTGAQDGNLHFHTLNSEDYNDEVMLNVLRCRLTY